MNIWNIISIMLMICAITISIIAIFLVYNRKIEFIEKWKQEAQQKFDQESRIQRESLKNEIQQKQNELTEVLRAGQTKLSELNSKRIQVEREISEKENFNSSLLKIREEELNRLIEEKKKTELLRLQVEIDDWAQSAQECAEFQRDQILEEYQKDIDNKYEELRNLYCEVNEYKEKRDAINQEILRVRAMEEKQDFYRIQISESSKHDLALLNEIRHEFSKIDVLDKLIYDNYIKKPVDEMIQRVLEGRAPSGIYKITRLKTGEIYIGRSTDIKSRWQQHCKSCYHCGTISHSKLHTIMENDGIWNFTFELLEETSKDKLTEREKYWINFYDSKKFGLNEREG